MARTHSVRAIAPPLETNTADLLPIRFNLRDLGGVEAGDGRRVAPGRLFRGAGLHQLEPEHLDAVAPCGIRTAIDLRSSEEIGRGSFAGEAATLHHLPIFETGPDLGDPGDEAARILADTYMWMLGEGPDSIRGAIELLGEPEILPAVVYCAAGKDRTGIVCAIVLTLVGVEREAIAADYAPSDAPATALREWHLDNGTPADQLAAAGVFRAPREAMLLFLTAVDERFGSLDAYLEGIGVDVGGARRRLAAALLVA
ncbi:MAG: tyrosine-protein phosphatase [Actinobacteria bacterium]|nr:tyrosine-protein phosphatase [Actinomycetota bacterium]